MFSRLAVHTGLALLLLSPVSAYDPSITRPLDAYLAEHPIVTRSALANSSQTSSVGTKHATIAATIPEWTPPISNVSRRRCPPACSTTGLDSQGWPVYHSVDRLGWCDQPMLLDFVLFNPLDDEKTHVGIAACAADLSTTGSAGNGSTMTGLCLPDTNSNNAEKVTAQLQLMSSSGTRSGTADNVVEAIGELQAFASLRSAGCNETIQFALSGEVAVAVYVGSGLSGQGVLPTVLEKLVDYVQDDGFSDSLLVQLCDASDRSARYALGVVAVTGSNLASAQTAVQTWKNSSCVSITSDQTAQTWQNITFAVPSSLSAFSSNSSNSSSVAAGSSKLRRRDDECTTVQIVSGDSCTTLAEECGVTLTEFEGYNDELCDSPLDRKSVV